MPLDGRFAETAGMVLDPHQEVVVLAPDGHESEVVVRLARIGFDHVLGYVPEVDAVLAEVPEHLAQASRVTPVQLEAAFADGTEVTVLDLRNLGELEAGSLPGSLHIPMAELRRRLDEVPRDGALVLYCAGGWRSSVGASYLRSQGFTDVSDILGGFSAWEATRTPVEV